MKTAKKTSKATANKKPTKKTAKAPRPAKGEPNVTKLEAELIAKYPTARIVEGSLLLPGQHDDFPAKRSVELLCLECDKVHRRATSDVFQAHYCGKECRKAAKKAQAANTTSKK